MIRCDICDQDFKSQSSLEKHNVTIKHITNSEIKYLRESNDSLTVENQRIIQELEEMNDEFNIQKIEIENFNNELNIKKMTIEDLNQKINNQKEIILDRAEAVKSLSNKIKELEEKVKKYNENDYFSLLSMGGIGLTIVFYFTKQYLA